jgi:sugar lactone lactonase YvrE
MDRLAVAVKFSTDSAQFIYFMERPMRSYDCSVLYRPKNEELAHLPEGPIVCGKNRFSWVSIQHGVNSTVGSLNIFDLSTNENHNYPLDGRPGFASPCVEEDTFVVGLEHRVGVFNTQSGRWTELCNSVDAGVERTIINDGIAFSSGLLFGSKTLDQDKKKAGLCFLRTSDLQFFQLRSDQLCSNGKVILDEGEQVRFLDIDTPTKKVVEYTLEISSGTLGKPREVLNLERFDDFPDGMIATPDGQGVIIAFYNPQDVSQGEVRQFCLADGSQEAVWKTPLSPRATCPLLIESSGVVKLIVTTAVEGMPVEWQARLPNAGCLFVGDTPFGSVPGQSRIQIETAT